MTRKLLTLIAITVLSSLSLAQVSITVSPPTVDNKQDTVTVRFKEGNTSDSFTITTDTLMKTTQPKDKAANIIAKINAAGKPVKAEVDPHDNAKINLTATKSDVKVLKPSISSNSAERDDKITAAAGVAAEFTTRLSGSAQFVDGSGDLSVLRIGTARGVVEVVLADAGSVEAAMQIALDGLIDLGIDAQMSDDGTISFELDSDLDAEAIFGCTDSGLCLTSDLTLPEDD